MSPQSQPLLHLFLLLTLLASPSLAHRNSASLIPASHQKVFPCAQATCRLSLCRLVVTTSLARAKPSPRPQGAPNHVRGLGMLMGGIFCQGKSLLVNVTIGEVLVRKKSSTAPPVPISAYTTPMLSRRFARNYFKTRSSDEDRQYRLFRGGGVPGQNRALHNLCMVVPVTQYQKVRRDGSFGRLIRSSDPADCVSLRTLSSPVMFVLQWDTSDDLDLFLTEPDGTTISRFSPRSPSSGRLNSDNGARCITITSPNYRVRESVFYTYGAPVQTGTYSMKVLHFRNCGAGPTAFTITAIIDGPTGLVRQERTGITNASNKFHPDVFKFDVAFA